MKLPVSYNHITVRQYQSIQPLLIDKMTLDDKISVLARLSGKTVEYIENLKINTLKKYFILISYLTEYPKSKLRKYLFIKGKLFKADTEADNLTTAQYCSIKTFCEGGKQIENLDKICAVVYKRLTWKGWRNDVKNFDKDCEMFKEIGLGKVYGVVFFCSIVLTYLMENTEDYLKAQQVIKEREQEVMNIILEGNF